MNEEHIQRRVLHKTVSTNSAYKRKVYLLGGRSDTHKFRDPRILVFDFDNTNNKYQTLHLLEATHV